MNAILNTNQASLKGCTLYVTLFPCNECAKLVIQSGVTHIVYLSDKHHEEVKYVAARRMLDLARVQYRPYAGARTQVTLDFEQVVKHTLPAAAL